jgi:hypothetical protein
MDLGSTPSILTFSQDERETVIPSESNEHLNIKKTKISSCGVYYKFFAQFGLMIIQSVFQIIILARDKN